MLAGNAQKGQVSEGPGDNAQSLILAYRRRRYLLHFLVCVESLHRRCPWLEVRLSGLPSGSLDE